MEEAEQKEERETTTRMVTCNLATDALCHRMLSWPACAKHTSFQLQELLDVVCVYWVVSGLVDACWGLSGGLSGPLGGSLDVSSGLSGTSSGPLWTSFGPLGGLLAPLGGLMDACWRARGSPKGGGLDMSVHVPPLGPLLGPSRGS